MKPKYTYSAFVTDVYDGDTITVDVDLGFGILKKGVKIRLKDINTPEVRGEERDEGIVARDCVRELILGRKVVLKTFKDKKGKYGRYLGEVFYDVNLPGGGTSRYNLNQTLLSNGMAEQWGE